MVPPDSHRITRAPCYSGKRIRSPASFTYGGHTLYAPPFKTIQLPARFITTPEPTCTQTTLPQPRPHNTRQLSHATGLASSASARHYSRNHNCFLFLRVLRCFTSPRSLHTTYTFSGGYRNMTCGGFPHSDILGSQVGCHLPEAYRRLLRPSSAPRAQASTVRPLRLGKHNKDTNKNCLQDARVHYAVLKKQPHTTT